MSTVNRSVERYHFTCRNCRRAWHAEYEVRTADEGDTLLQLYYRDGATCMNPSGDVIICPSCHHSMVKARRQSTRPY